MIDHRPTAAGSGACASAPLSRSAATWGLPATPPPASAIPLDAALISSDGSFSGYASLFDVPDLSGDVISPGAFQASLARRPASAVRLLYQHAAADPIGVWRTLREDGRGLFAQGQLTTANSKARDVLALLRSGAIDGLSIGFRAARGVRNSRTGLRRLTELDLWEISIVTFPMLPGARVSAVKTGEPRARSPTLTTPSARLAALSASIRAAT